jgi:uncharacterized membrane protein YuzA (DUF378 family)
MRPQNPIDWVAFVFLLIGAFAWGYFFLTGMNFIEILLNPISDVLSALVYLLILLAGIYWILRVTVLRSWGGGFYRRRRRRR